MQKGVKFRIYPNKEQKDLINSWYGTYHRHRYTYTSSCIEYHWSQPDTVWSHANPKLWYRFVDTTCRRSAFRRFRNIHRKTDKTYFAFYSCYACSPDYDIIHT